MFAGLVQSFPTAALEKYVPILVPLLKVLMLALIAYKYKASRLHPFSRMAYQFAAAGALCKLVFFCLYYGHEASFDGGFPGSLFQDLSFCLALTGVVVTLALDFLWALSSALENETLFRHDWVASDVALTWYMIQIPLVIVLVSLRYIPWSCNKNFPLEWSVLFVLISSFGFVWYCLFKVRGASESDEFKQAYKAAFIVNIICTCLVAQNSFFFLVYFANPDFAVGYRLQEHMCETIGIFAMIVYFTNVKSQPDAIHNHMHDLDNKKATLQHKSSFGALVGIQCEGLVEKAGKASPLLG